MSSTIDNLPSGAPAQAGDELPIQRGASNFKLTVANITALAPATTPGGSPGDIQFNNSGAFGGVTKVPLANGGTNADLSASGSSTAVLAQDASHVISARSLVAADIPTLDASKITTGAIALARGGTGVDLSASGSAHAFLAEDGSHVISARQPAASDISGLAPSATTDTTNASNITSGKLALAEGGTNVDLSTSGSSTAVLAQDASHVISARALVAADIPNLDAAKITTGALALARGGTAVDLSASGSSTAILAQDASHVISARALVAADIPNLDASKITTGQLALAQGGTNADLSSSGGATSFLAQNASHVISARVIGLADLPSPTTTAKGGFWGLTIFPPQIALAGNTGNVSAANKIRAILFTLPFPTTVTGLAIQVNATAQTGTVLDVGLYDINGNGILNSNGSGFGGVGLSGATAGVKSATFTKVTLAAGQYYLAWTGQTSGTLASVNYMILGVSANAAGISAAINGMEFQSSDSATSGILPSSLTLAHLSAGSGFDPPATWFAA